MPPSLSIGSCAQWVIMSLCKVSLCLCFCMLSSQFRTISNSLIGPLSELPESSSSENLQKFQRRLTPHQETLQKGNPGCHWTQDAYQTWGKADMTSFTSASTNSLMNEVSKNPTELLSLNSWYTVC